ncbi:aspartate/glutamate racemase family protein [Rhizobium sp. L1K21]|uniref:aspartate/glutamate racemase family protein n=1 Tax=Rhizobium sp. L1K21 TaxID=2954933 RepID=UPI0020936112|nr:aspartate/glutamate racemase family protein [Rhizobium sp. L1K21]MCO6185726.1 aspartate/glutamate racemase family protein [Rhizobium sp. L1K21]
MKRIGLIGGMSFESSAVYYKLINEMVREALGGLSSADLFLHSVDFAEIVAMQKAGKWDDAANKLAESAKMLEKSGADCILICTNTMHKVADTVAASVDIPLISIIDETAKAIKSAGASKPLLLATRYTMEHGFYQQVMARHGLEIMVPEAADRTMVHDIIFEELCAGKVDDQSRQRMMAIVDAAKADGADSVILGCTEICLLVDEHCLSLPVFDSTAIHCEAALSFALSGEPGMKQATKAA